MEQNPIIRLKDTPIYLGISKSTIHNKLNRRSKYFDPAFPQPIKLGLKAKGYHKNVLDHYLEMLNKQAQKEVQSDLITNQSM